jgi:NitT/TauT family transport system permease protein
MPDSSGFAVVPSSDQSRFSRLRGHKTTLSVYALSCVFLIVIIALWQLAVTFEMASALILPPPVEVWQAFVGGVIAGHWWNDIYLTIKETVLGAVVGVVSAILVGAVFAYIDVLRRAAYPYVLAVQTFPKVALAPLLMAWLGYGIVPKILISAMLAFFPVFTNTLTGFLEVDPSSIELLRMMRASKLQELRYLRMPNALVFILPSLDVALVLALLGAIAAELAGAEGGVGQVIVERSFQGDTASVYAALLLLAIIGIALRAATNFSLRGLRRGR